jgi:hypothetical protein
MALLCAKVDTDQIRLSDDGDLTKFFGTIMSKFSSQMLAGGNYALLPNHAAMPS